jgi:hypothetical protein
MEAKELSPSQDSVFISAAFYLLGDFGPVASPLE